MKRSWRVLFLILLLASLTPSALAAPGKEAKAKPKPTPWLKTWDQATSYARKDNRCILLYFSGSDWDPWTQKLEKDVLNTEIFQQWIEKNVIPMQADFAKDKIESSITKQQNEKLKLRYSIGKVPTFILTNPAGEPFSRFGYDDLRLRDEELQGEPKAAIAFLTGELAKRPGNEDLITEWSLPQAMTLAKKRYRLLVMAVTKGAPATVIRDRDTLYKDQRFVHFINHNVLFYPLQWPDETDRSPDALAFRDFAERHKLEQAPFEFIIWQPYGDQILSRISSFDLMHVDQLVNQLNNLLPHLDYTSGWITDMSEAQAIAAQQQRFVFASFESDNGDWTKKMRDEIYETDEFKTYARKHLVLVKVDFPTATTQPEALAKQNHLLAELYNVRGFPTIVVLNWKGKEIVKTKYIKGGVTPFLKQIGAILSQEEDRLRILQEK